MSKVFIDTLIYRWKREGTYVQFSRGFKTSFPPFTSGERTEFTRQFLTSILLHDEIYIRIGALEEVVSLLEIANVLLLIEKNILKIIDDEGPTIAFMPNGDDNLLMSLGGGGDFKFEAIEKRIAKSYTGHFDNRLTGQMIATANDKSIKLDGDWLGHLSDEEVVSDLKNKNITGFLRISQDYDNIIVKDQDILPIARLRYFNSSLVYQHELKLDSLLTESVSRKLLSLKFSPNLIDPLGREFDLFSKITFEKRIPDLTELFIRKIIPLEEILTLRSSSNGKKFRRWLETMDYDQVEVTHALLRSVKSLKDKPTAKLIRWIYPTVMGVANPFGGIAVSAIDSFIIDKILAGWHPNFFLDDELGARLNKLQATGKPKK